MLIDVVDFELSHLDDMDMREHESNLDLDFETLLKASVKSKTVMIDGVIITCYGITEEANLWQIPSKHIPDYSMTYARGAREVIRDLIKGRKDAYSYCLKDQVHDRWMKFLGFKRSPDYEITFNGTNYVLYEVA